MHHFEDEHLTTPTDIKEYKDYVYVCSGNQVRKYNRLNGELIKAHSTHESMAASNMLFHTNWGMNKGE